MSESHVQLFACILALEGTGMTDRPPPDVVRPTRVLVVEDDEGLRSLICATLERNGYEVAEAQDGREAMRRFEARPADVVVTDIYMPVKDGIELIQELGAYVPRVPVIAISGGGQTHDASALAAAEWLGAIAVITKPFGSPALLDAVRRAVEQIARRYSSCD